MARQLNWDKKWVLGNWKMNGSLHGIDTFFEGFESYLKESQDLSSDKITDSNIEAGIAFPSVYLQYGLNKNKGIFQRALSKLSEEGVSFLSSSFYVGAEDVSHFKNNGAFTGEVNSDMLKDIGVDFCLIGHSERRTYFHESNDILKLKLENLELNNITPIFCIGENLDERNASMAENVVAQQLQVLEKLTANKICIAYEPVWAIGTGVSATVKEIQAIHQFIRSHILSLLKRDVNIQILYGGSVKPENIEEILSLEDVDGALVGGASLKFSDYQALLFNAQKATCS